MRGARLLLGRPCPVCLSDDWQVDGRHAVFGVIAICRNCGHRVSVSV